MKPANKYFRSRGKYILSLLPKQDADSGGEEPAPESAEENVTLDDESLEAEIQNLFDIIDVPLSHIDLEENFEIVENTNIDQIEKEARDEQQNENEIIKCKKLPRKKLKKRKYKWKREPFISEVAVFNNEVADQNIDEESEISKREFFFRFFSPDIIQLITDQTNLYKTQQNICGDNVTEEDIIDFIAVEIMMGVIQMPSYTDYWSNSLRYSKIADVMALKKYQKIRRILHFSNNLEADISDRYNKIRPIIEKIRSNFSKIPEENKYSIDEMMVPYKGKRAGNLRQYMKNKPTKWGFKMFVRAGVSGIIYDFFIYEGQNTFRRIDFTPKEKLFNFSSQCVIALTKSIQSQAMSTVYFDNFFTNPEMMVYLRKEFGILTLGTLRKDRLFGAENILQTDKELTKKGKGSYDQVVDNRKNLVCVKWLDTKPVRICSSFVGAEPVGAISRYNRNTKKREMVPCPYVIKQYNKFMGGVDLADMFVALYRTSMRTHKWYMAIFSHLLDCCISNAWLQYRSSSQNKKCPLKEFRIQLADELLHFQRSRQPRSIKSSPLSVPPLKTKNRAPVINSKSDPIRLDQTGHWPQLVTAGKCRHCKTGQTTMSCRKCNVRLCFTKKRNCYTSYHSGSQ